MKLMIKLFLALFAFCIFYLLINHDKIEKITNNSITNNVTKHDLIKINGVPLIQQYPLLPNGCEAVSSTMVLQYYGFEITEEEFVNDYLSMKPLYYENGILCGPDPAQAYAGNPFSTTEGLGCYAPVITKALENASDNHWKVENISGSSLDDLRIWLQKDIPVILWATIEMQDIESYIQLYNNGKYIEYPTQEHCLVFIGMDEEFCYFNDPLNGKEVSYKKEQVLKCYNALQKQAVVMYSI